MTNSLLPIWVSSLDTLYIILHILNKPLSILASIVTKLSQQVGLLIRKVETLEQAATKEHKELLNEIKELKKLKSHNSDSEKPTKKRRIETVLPNFPIESLEVMDDMIKKIKDDDDFKKDLVST